MAGDNKFEVLNGLVTNNIEFFSPNRANSVIASMSDGSNVLSFAGTVRSNVIVMGSNSIVNTGEVLLDFQTSSVTSTTITLTRSFNTMASNGYRGFRIIARGITNNPTVRYTNNLGTAQTSNYITNWAVRYGASSLAPSYTIASSITVGPTIIFTPSSAQPYNLDIYFFIRGGSATGGATGSGRWSSISHNSPGSNADNEEALFVWTNQGGDPLNGVYISGSFLSGGFVKIYGVL